MRSISTNIFNFGQHFQTIHKCGYKIVNTEFPNE